MELNILHLYPDCMSLYGEWANVAVLRRHLEAAGVTVSVTRCPLDETPDFTRPDFIYMGCGTERTQKAVLMALKDRGDELKAALERGAVVLFTGNAMEVLGKGVTDRDGRPWTGMGVADFTTVETDQRTPEDVIVRTELWSNPAVGFMNKCSRTVGITTPLFHKVEMGFGNEGAKGGEGYVDGNLFATHITGPVLVKNPCMVNLMIRRLFDAKGWEVPCLLPVLPHEMEAYQVTLRELAARAGLKMETEPKPYCDLRGCGGAPPMIT